MSDNHIWIFFIHNFFKHSDKVFFYSDFDEKKYVPERVKEVLNTKCNKNEKHFKRIRSKEKAMMEVKNISS